MKTGQLDKLRTVTGYSEAGSKELHRSEQDYSATFVLVWY